MMTAPHPADADEPFSAIDWGERGNCPACGSGRVIHRVIGMVLANITDSAPPWVVFDGCCGLGPSRECLACGHGWSEGGDEADGLDGAAPV